MKLSVSFLRWEGVLRLRKRPEVVYKPKTVPALFFFRENVCLTHIWSVVAYNFNLFAFSHSLSLAWCCLGINSWFRWFWEGRRRRRTRLHNSSPKVFKKESVRRVSRKFESFIGSFRQNRLTDVLKVTIYVQYLLFVYDVRKMHS